MTTETKRPTTMTMAVIGRIDRSRQHDGKTYTHITTPAPDEYSMPSQFEIRSEQQLGPIGTEFRGKVRASGFIRPRQYTDRNTGELKQVHDKTVILDLVVQ